MSAGTPTKMMMTELATQAIAQPRRLEPDRLSVFRSDKMLNDKIPKKTTKTTSACTNQTTVTTVSVTAALLPAFLRP